MSNPPPPPPPPSKQEETQRSILVGKADPSSVNNAVSTSKYSWWSFLPVAIREQFRRNGNVYFLVMGCLMFLGTYTTLFETSVNPWTTLGPLAIVVSVSLAQEAAADIARHKSDYATNTHPCVILRRSEDLTPDQNRDMNIMAGQDFEVRVISAKKGFDSLKNTTDAYPVDEQKLEDGNLVHDSSAKIAFVSVRRKDIRAGDIILVRNRDMIPADIILLASSGEDGAAYIETSPIDGETNLKLRNSPRLPKGSLHMSTPRLNFDDGAYDIPKHETFDQAVKRITRMSLLGFPHGLSSLENPNNISQSPQHTVPHHKPRRSSIFGSQTITGFFDHSDEYVATLTSELPNASVNTFSGKLTLPPTVIGQPSQDIALSAENILLRGAFLRNTEWILGVACFTGSDTKLVRNSFRTPSKFSRVDMLMNKLVVLILFIMLTCVLVLAVLATRVHSRHFDELWYASYLKNSSELWPYLQDLPAPKWDDKPPTFMQFVFTYITLLNNFVPLSLYVTVEVITLFMMYLISWDKNMYHADTDTPAVARSTIVTDLGQVKYVFSDKTGTLTQNIMRFKRCSVDGLIFGSPIEKVAPTNKLQTVQEDEELEDSMMTSAFHPLKALLVGNVPSLLDGNYANEDSFVNDSVTKSVGTKTLTFNAEMFLRILSICHTVVVEKEHDGKVLEADSEHSKSKLKSLFGGKRSRLNTGDSNKSRLSNEESKSSRIDVSNRSPEPILANDPPTQVGKSNDGSPAGYAYQAESPDEGAFVSAASLIYGFQLISRDSGGVNLLVSSPSLLAKPKVSEKLKNGNLLPKDLACITASPVGDKKSLGLDKDDELVGPVVESWSILGVNKFDSDRKRMSVIVRSPPQLGSIPMILCKGADSSMLDPSVCEGQENIIDDGELYNGEAALQNDGDKWRASTMLGIQAHLGQFASEGLRTLVLGVRILTEKELADWLTQYNAAASSISNRSTLLKKAAFDIEKKLHIVGATAIEDKLQVRVPETIENIRNAGIKLWVLTGDKRETAIEIGYSTKVLHPKMYLTDVAEGDDQVVKTIIAMEFMRLVKSGKLPQYQTSSCSVTKKRSLFKSLFDCSKCIGHVLTVSSRAYRRFYHQYIKTCFGTCNKGRSEVALELIDREEERERIFGDPIIRCRKVREIAENIIREYMQSPAGLRERASRLVQIHEDPDKSYESLESLETSLLSRSSSVPSVFARARSAQSAMDLNNGHVTQAAMRSISLASATSNAPHIVDEDTLSLQSFVPGTDGNITSSFNKKKRTIMEKLFAVDPDVRKGRLNRHTFKGKQFTPASEAATAPILFDADRGLVIEGGALAHFLGDTFLEEILFSVASNCQSVIACRVSPKQKALLVKLVRSFVNPTPVTLAIGDGANDVGMIQEAHVGVGISGLEGQQAVNASDFAIAQFRFLEDLLLIHGRWNFIRLSKVILFSFYKNALLVGTLLVFSPRTLYSGTPLYDNWVYSAFNFVCGFPILLLGIFDRDLEPSYVKQHPELYSSGPNNEHLSLRVFLRWVILCVCHSLIISYLCMYSLMIGGGMSSAFRGLMAGQDMPGEGEGADLKVYGTTVFTALVWVLAIKVLYESSSLIHGREPAIRCGRSRELEGGFMSRIAYTWHGVIFLSIGFNFFFLYVYQILGKSSASSFSPFVMVTNHLFNYRSITWMVILIVTIASTGFDVIGKVFSNMYFPTQTQIHKEMQKKRGRSEEYLRQGLASP